MGRTARRFGVGSLMGLVAGCALVFAVGRANPGAGVVVASLLLIAFARVRELETSRATPPGVRHRVGDWATSLGVACLLVLVGGLGVLTGVVTLFFLPGVNILVGLGLAAYLVARTRRACWPAPPIDREGIAWLEEIRPTTVEQ